MSVNQPGGAVGVLSETERDTGPDSGVPTEDEISLLDLSIVIVRNRWLIAKIALFVAPVLVLLSYLIGPAPMDLNFWPGAVAMILFATLTASLVTTSGRSAWFVGVLAILVYLIFATALYLLPPQNT